jgi:multicomponent Na+:H+ antiporter subunit E
LSDEASNSGRQRRGKSRFAPATWIALFLLWVVLSGKFDAFHLLVGLATIAFIAWLQSALVPLRGVGDPRIRGLQLALYIPWLLWQMLLSSIYVARVILWDYEKVDPQLIAFSSKQPSVLHRVILANSITLTPGTLTVDLRGDRFLVHALTPSTAADVLNGRAADKVARLSVDNPQATPESCPTDEFASK